MKTKVQVLGVMAFLAGFAVMAARADAAPVETKKAYMPSGTLQSLQKGDFSDMKPVEDKTPAIVGGPAVRGRIHMTCSDTGNEEACRNNEAVKSSVDKKADPNAAKKKDASKKDQIKDKNVKPAGGVPVPGRNFMSCSGANPAYPSFSALEEACRNSEK